jgi:3'-phosphoadenosine 5'-phosphosulfate sulfotransferase
MPEAALVESRAGEEALLICIQTACEVLGEQVQPAFLPDLIRDRLDALKKQLQVAQQELKTARHTGDGEKVIEAYKERAVKADERNKRLVDAIKNLRDVKGRHHTEIATTQLFELLREIDG